VAAPACLAVAALASSALAGCASARSPSPHESLGSEVDAKASEWVKREHLAGAAARGAHLFAQVGCLSCHTYAGTGARNLGARDLTRVGRRRSARSIERYVANPRRFGDKLMPVFGEAFSARQVGDIAAFLAASKGAA